MQEEDSATSVIEAPHATISTDELVLLWGEFRQGTPAACPRDARPVAVAVDAVAHAYRMICVTCGAASPWFESRPTGMRIRSGTSSMPSPRTLPDE